VVTLHISIINSVPFLWSESNKIGNEEEVLQSYQLLMEGKSVPDEHTEKMYAWLPAKGKKHYPSSALTGMPPEGKSANKLVPFKIAAVPVSYDFSVRLISWVQPQKHLSEEIYFSSSLKWLADVYKFALQLISSESFLPDLVKVNNSFIPMWRMALNDDGERFVNYLYQILPASICCITRTKTEPPKLMNREDVRALLESTMDFFIRIMNGELKIGKPSSVHEEWLKGLLTPKLQLKWKKEEEQIALWKELQRWQEHIQLVSASAYRMSFRLYEPEEGDSDEVWILETLVYPKADPSLLLSVNSLIGQKKKKQKALEKYGLPSLEWIINALGQATGIYPVLKECLNADTGYICKLNTGQAFEFLTIYAQALQTEGFQVLLPSWWVKNKTATRIGLKLSSKSVAKVSSGVFNLNAILDYDLSACIGDTELSLQELKELSALKTPLVQVRGQWINIDPSALKAAISHLEKKEELTAKELIQLALGSESKFKNIDIQQVHFEGWLSKLLDVFNGKAKPQQLPQPKNLCGELRPYQLVGFSWLHYLQQWGFGACLADDMGLGKTVQTLALIIEEKNKGNKKPVLLICPTTVVNNWRKESERFTPELKVIIHHGSTRKKQTDFAENAKKVDLVISSFGLLHRDLPLLNEVSWAGVVIDEAQNIKNPETLQAKAARSIKASYRIALTGTPVENSPSDLWSIMEFLNPGILGSQQAFMNNFYKPIQFHNDISAAEKLKRITSPFILRRLKTDKKIIKDLPEKIEVKEYCPLTKEQITLYKAVADDLQNKVLSAEGIERKGLILTAILRLKQVCNHPAQFAGDNSAIMNRSGKLQRLLEICSEVLENNEKALIFTQFREMGEILQKALQMFFGREILFLHGGVPKNKRDIMIERFQQDSSASPFFVLSLKAGGTGLNLTAASNVIHYDRWWNPAVENQATDRAYRIGQNKKVQVHKFVVSGTLEEKIDELLERKIILNESLIGTGESWLTELSNKEFRELIKLSENVSGE
jgi:SNF2 family DNA or RNA helicase